MESAPINLQAPLDRRRALLAKLMAQGGAAGAAGAARGGGFRAGVMGGRGFHNASDLAMAPLPQINLGFHPAQGIIPGGFQADPSAALTPFAGPAPSWTSFTPPPFQGGGEPPDVGGGAPVAFNPAAAPPPSYTGPVRSLTGYDGPVDAPDPWSVFNRFGSGTRSAFRF